MWQTDMNNSIDACKDANIDGAINTYEIHKEKAVACLHEINKNLKEDLVTKTRTNNFIIKENFKLMAENRLLNYRSRELSKIKFEKHFTPRTRQLVDAANFSDFLGYMDKTLIETEVPITEDIGYESEHVIARTQMYELKELRLLNGEIVVKKTARRDLNLSKVKMNCYLLHETKILRLIGKHPNIVSALGIYLSNSCVYSMVLTYEANVTLKKMFDKIVAIEFEVTKHILLKLSDAIEYIHFKHVLHNGIVPTNVCLRFNSLMYEPILVGFSCAMRICSSKPLTIYQQERFKEMVHLPIEVRQGLRAPSISSDLYALKILIRKFMAHSKEEHAQDILRGLMNTLSMQNPKENLQALVNHCISS